VASKWLWIIPRGINRTEYSAYLSRCGRADERTRTAFPISLRVRFVPLYLGGKALTYFEMGSQRIAVFCPITLRLA
jgi:hypothetical protein